jgi:hypothetical protein
VGGAALEGEKGGAAAHYASLAPGVPLIESPFFDRFADEMFPEAELSRVAGQLNRDGYAIIDFPEPDFDRVADEIVAALSPRFDWAGWRAHAWPAGIGMREQDSWTTDANVKRIACNAALMRMLARLYGRRMWPFQTLSFPVGTQQHYHSDSVHFSTIPERFMCGVWVALEDVTEDAGPLVYYPGTHKWPVLYNETIGHRVAGQDEHASQTLYEPFWRELVAESGIEPHYFTPRKGQALIWSANLLHGGAKQTNGDRSRWSQVTHYYGDDCLYLTPMLSDVATGNTYFRSVVDISTGATVENRYIGAPLSTLSPGVVEQRDTRIIPGAPQAPVPHEPQGLRRVLANAGLLGVARTAKRLLSGPPDPNKTRRMLH